VIVVCTAGAEWTHRQEPTRDMAAAASAFLDALTPELRARASVPLNDKAREDWHYVPRERAGVEFGAMTDHQRMAARALLRSVLSSRGMNKVEQIMLLDAVLRETEHGRGPRRDPLAYSIAIFGTPGRANEPWGWKIEGHHISLNFTAVVDAMAVTPSFLGANPAEVGQGERAGVRALAWEEDLARELLASLNAEQRRAAIISDQAPPDIMAVPGRALDEIDSGGAQVSSMDQRQRCVIERLLEEYAGTLRHELAEHELERIRAAGIENVRFAWMGSDRRGEGHYYRLSGPTFVIEYDNTQDHANHVHTVWRDRQRDFGHDLLKEHHAHGHAGH
jgi:hypothetical protein